MPYEIDFLPVGEGERSGDAIALRFGDLQPGGHQRVVVIDGGSKDSGARLVEHIEQYYRTNRVDLVISTHPDADHASGLSVVLEKMQVGLLWMHQPWNHASARLFRDGRLTDDSLEGRLREELEAAHDIEQLAQRRGVTVQEPFTGVTYSDQKGWLQVLGPTPRYYEELLLQFRSTPEPKAAAFAESIFGRALSAGIEYAKWILEDWGRETLQNPDVDATSAENNSSAIILFGCDGHYSLFTGDAGVPALDRAVVTAQNLGVDLRSCRFQQIPHHGSRRNVGPDLLNRLVGMALRAPADSSTVAFVSASSNGEPKHPAKKATNAYLRRGRKVVSTQGKGIRHHHLAPQRTGWITADIVPFHREVDE